MTRRTGRAHAFATRHFATCDAHLAAAQAVFEQIENLAKHEVPSLAPDDRIGDVLGYSPAALRAAADSLCKGTNKISVGRPRFRFDPNRAFFASP